MKKLEDKIIKKMYVLETKKTGFSIVTKIIFFLFSGLAVIFFTQILIEIFFETGSDSFFEIMGEDGQVIVKHAGDIISALFQEVPKSIILAILISLLILIFILLTSLRNFGKIRYKVMALVRYWEKGHNSKKV